MVALSCVLADAGALGVEGAAEGDVGVEVPDVVGLAERVGGDVVTVAGGPEANGLTFE